MTTFILNIPTECHSTLRRKPTISTLMISSQQNSRQIFQLYPSQLVPIRAMRISTSQKNFSMGTTAEIIYISNLWTMASEMLLSRKKMTRGWYLRKKKNPFHKSRQLNYKSERVQKKLKTLMMKQRTSPRTTSKPSSPLFWKTQTILKVYSVRPI